MDKKVAEYRKILMEIMSGYADNRSLAAPGEKETIVVFDEKHDHYFLHRIGWEGTKRIWNTTLYVRIRNGKFYIEIDWTEDGIATPLMAAGIPKEDIVLAFHHPSMRQYTEFAVA
ncbi:MAG: XisI protein [Caldilineaceae bacterium]|nr:XisI protein [Caldilineaceae bacterium]